MATTFLLWTALGQAQTVQISDTLYNANGSKASGRLVISASTPFTAAGGGAVGLAPIQVTIPASGAVTVSLYPNVGAAPSGTSYQVRYILNSGAQYTETWVVPASGPVPISAVRVNVVPTPAVLFLPSQASAVDAPADEECLTYETTGNKFEWQGCGTGSGVNSANEEGPAGAVDGVNLTYTLAHIPSPATSLKLAYNGMVLLSGAGNDFTISGNTITMLYAPVAGSNFVAWYEY